MTEVFEDESDGHSDDEAVTKSNEGVGETGVIGEGGKSGPSAEDIAAWENLLNQKVFNTDALERWTWPVSTAEIDNPEHLLIWLMKLSPYVFAQFDSVKFEFKEFIKDVSPEEAMRLHELIYEVSESVGKMLDLKHVCFSGKGVSVQEINIVGMLAEALTDAEIDLYRRMQKPVFETGMMPSIAVFDVKMNKQIVPRIMFMMMNALTQRIIDYYEEHIV